MTGLTLFGLLSERWLGTVRGEQFVIFSLLKGVWGKSCACFAYLSKAHRLTSQTELARREPQE